MIPIRMDITTRMWKIKTRILENVLGKFHPFSRTYFHHHSLRKVFCEMCGWISPFSPSKKTPPDFKKRPQPPFSVQAILTKTAQKNVRWTLIVFDIKYSNSVTNTIIIVQSTHSFSNIVTKTYFAALKLRERYFCEPYAFFIVVLKIANDEKIRLFAYPWHFLISVICI